MNLLIYHFLKYSKETPFEYLVKNYSEHSCLCFDLEDSIQDILSPSNTPSFKQKYRETLEYLFSSNNHKINELNIAVRVNPLHSDEFKKDINTLTNLTMYHNHLTIFLPKVETSNDIFYLYEVLNRISVPFNEIIAIIESKKGMINLHSILKQRSDKFNKIAFGHCDYNYSLGNFPFNHHDSEAYWHIVDPMMILAESMEFTFLNSPCLYLDDEYIFSSILNRIMVNTKSNSTGQIVLTHKQAKWCQTFIQSRDSNMPLPSNIQFRIPKSYEKMNSNTLREYAARIISEFENNLDGKAFSISPKERFLISPKEYLAAKKYL